MTAFASHAARPAHVRPALGLAAALFALAPFAPANAETLVAAFTIRPGTVLTAEHLARAEGDAGPGVLSTYEHAVGLEARVSLYKGRPIRAVDLAPPTLVRRNDVVTLEFIRGSLSLRTEARALDRGGLGDRIRVMNIDSRRTVFATVAGPGRATIGAPRVDASAGAAKATLQ